MSDRVTARHILERWTIGVKKEDRRHEKMPPLFEQLAAYLFAAGVSFEVANDVIRQGAKAVYPATEIIKHVYSKSPAKKFKSLIEFTKSWQEDLDKMALEAFYVYYDIEGIDPNKLSPTKKLSIVKEEEHHGMVSEDELNQEDFWKSVKKVTKDKPWLFLDEDKDAQ